MAALCTSVIFLRAPLPLGARCGFPPGCGARWAGAGCSAGTAELRGKGNALCCSAGPRKQELMHKMRPHRGDAISLVLYQRSGCVLAARLLSPAPYFSLQRDIGVVWSGRRLFVVVPYLLLSVCPKDEQEQQTLSESGRALTRRQRGELFSVQHTARTCSCASTPTLPHVVSVLPSADLPRWIKCSPTGLKSQI